MLVLTRRAGQTVVIDGAISVTVMAVMGGKVRLGVTAPLSVRVDRSEVHARRQVLGPASLTAVCPSALDGE